MYNEEKPNSEAKFSIIIPTWNNLDYVKLCVNSIRKNSRFRHQIILHINDGSDGSKAWAEKENIDHTASTKNVGICWAVNDAARLANTDYIVYMNDDMYVLPDWDLHLWNEIQQLPDDLFFLSSTMIEPTGGENPCVIFDPRFGDSIETFDEELLLKEAPEIPMHDWQGATWPPNIVSKRVWQMVGGYSVEFSPGMTSDPDFSRKLWALGIRYFKGIGKSRVYHFQCKSTGRITKNNGKQQFLEKWGMSASDFCDITLERGKVFYGPLTDNTVKSVHNERLLKRLSRKLLKRSK